MSKRLYEIFCAKNESSNKKSYSYTYKNTKIDLVISEDSFSAKIEMDSKYDSTTFLESDYSEDIIRKALLLHLILYSKELKINELTIKVDNQEKKDNSITFIHSLVSGELLREIPKKWKDEPKFIQKILDTVKTKYDSRFSALFAFIIAKSKQYEIERFQNLWISMNGLYNFYSSLIKKENIRENKKIQLFQFYNDWSYEEINSKKRTEISTKLSEIIKTTTDLQNSKAEFDKSDLKDKIQAILDKEGKNYVDCYGFIILHYAYYLRCNYFHANKPLPLICFNKNDYITLQFVNNLLEGYLSENLYKYFCDNFVKKQNKFIKDNEKEIIKIIPKQDKDTKTTSKKK